MAENNSVNDSYNPPPVASEFEVNLFEDIEVDDLIWVNNNSLNGIVNPVHRRITENTVQNLQSGHITHIDGRQKVYQKT